MFRNQLRRWTVPLSLLGATVLAYGVFIPLLGLYGDDWPYLWVKHTVGTAGYIDFVSWDRPFSAWIYLLVTPILGEQVWAYHLFLVGLRWLDAVLFWWVLRLVWPRWGQAGAAAALLFVIYPGFKQQAIPLEFMLHFSVLALFLFSLGAMLRAVNNRKRFVAWTAAALVGQVGIFSLEYFFGLELLRPLLLWISLRQQEKDRRKLLVRVLLNWLPYLVVLAVFVAWRALVFKFPTYQPQNLTTLPALLNLMQRVFLDLKIVTLDAWLNTLAFPTSSRALFLVIGLGLAAGVLAGWCAWTVGRSRGSAENRSWKRSLALIIAGLAALLAAGWPFWITGLPVEVTFPWDRSTLPFMVGASLLLAGLVDLGGRRLAPIILGGLVFLAVGLHAQSALSYRTESTKLRDFFWQLSWRAPALKPGTIVLSEQIPLFYYSDNSLTPPLNWTYDPAQDSGKQTFNLFDVDERLGGTLKALQPDLPVKRTYRSYSFSGNTSNILMVFARPGSCLRVLSAEDEHIPGLPSKLSEALELSHLDQIDAGSTLEAKPPAQVGSEPEHGWCYYFEKASLARQREDWGEVSSLGEEVQSLGLSPHDRSEWLPFILGAALSGQQAQALAWSEEVRQQENLHAALCAVWAQARLLSPTSAAIQEAMRQTDCQVNP